MASLVVVVLAINLAYLPCAAEQLELKKSLVKKSRILVRT